MPKYIARYSESLDEEIDYPDSITVHESDDTDTGLLDPAGRPIYRVDRVPCGYVRSRETG